MRVLLVEDDSDIANFLISHLPAHGFVVDAADTGAQGIALTQEHDYDLVVLDLNLPDMPGERICEAVRKRDSAPPVLILSVVANVAEKVRLLNAGADDYLVKPFSFQELVARMRALLRRPSDIVPNVLTNGDLVLDAVNGTVHRGKRLITLTRKEFALLEYLLRCRGTVVSKGTLIEHVWGRGTDPLSATLETHMANLRKKLGKPPLIHTIHTRGYKIER